MTAPVALAGYWIDRGAFPYARLDRHFKPHRDGQETTFTAIHGGSTLPST
ncbi:MAG: hypothetical protein EPN40_10420 [Rhodanobacteraceae bacterium]|nr:MAG: hypothetical protein EPN40_10420 [Rhodanobacteraceae bacterium]